MPCAKGIPTAKRIHHGDTEGTEANTEKSTEEKKEKDVIGGFWPVLAFLRALFSVFSVSPW